MSRQRVLSLHSLPALQQTYNKLNELNSKVKGKLDKKAPIEVVVIHLFWTLCVNLLENSPYPVSLPERRDQGTASV